MKTYNKKSLSLIAGLLLIYFGLGAGYANAATWGGVKGSGPGDASFDYVKSGDGVFHNSHSVESNAGNIGNAVTTFSGSGTACNRVPKVNASGGCSGSAQGGGTSGYCVNSTPSATLAVVIASNATQACKIVYRGESGAGNAERTQIIKIKQHIFFPDTPNTKVGDPAYSMKATAGNIQGTSSGIAPTYSASGACTVDTSSGMITNNSTGGNCTLTASAAGNGNWTAATGTISWIIKKLQTINITTSPPTTADIESVFTTAATALGGAVTIAASGMCTLQSGGSNTATIRMTGGGDCTITYTRAATNDYAAAPTLTRTTTAAKKDQIITFEAQAAQVYALGKVFAINPLATSISNGVIAYASASPLICTITGAQDNQVAVLAAGTCVITANQAGTAEYNAAPQAQQSIAISKAPQQITVTQAAPAAAEAGSSFTVAASASSGLPVAISWSGTGCANSGSATSSASIEVAGSGACNIAYNQAGNGNYNAANQETQLVSITLLLQQIVITQPADARRYMSDGPFTVAAESRNSQGQPTGVNVLITTTGGCTGSGSNGTASITLTDATTTCYIHYNTVSSPLHEDAVERMNEVQAIRIRQSISVTQFAPQKAAKDQTFTVAANSTSSLPVAISVTGECSGSGSNTTDITMNSAESGCTVRFNQAGDDEYEPASEVLNVVRDGTAPTISEIEAMASQTNANPSYSFNSTEQGTIIYSGSCQSTTSSASAGDNRIVFERMHEGSYDNCAIQVKDAAGNLSNKLEIGEFNVIEGVKAYVADLGQGNEDCSSWANACSDIQQAINDPLVDTIWLKKGVYRPTETLQLKPGVSLLGGFAGTESTAKQANPAKNLTIISGDVDINDTVNSQGLVTQVADVQGGNLPSLLSAINLGVVDNGSQVLVKGVVLNAASNKAVIVKSSQLQLEQVRLIANQGDNGAAVSVQDGGKLKVVSAWFEANSASNKGGAISSDSNGANTIEISASTFDANTAKNAGGAISLEQGELVVINSTFANNVASEGSANGGAIDLGVLANESSASIKYSTFMANSAGASSGRGGAIHVSSSAAVGVASLANSLLLANTAKTGANISDMEVLRDRGFNIVGFNNVSGTVKNGANYNFAGTSLTAKAINLEEIVASELKLEGGFTPTLALPVTSIAVDRIPSVHQDCGAASELKADQRGKSRPDMNKGNCDVGAYEAEVRDYCESIKGFNGGLNVNQNPQDGSLCGNGWQIGTGSSNAWLLGMLLMLGVLRMSYKKGMRLKA